METVADFIFGDSKITADGDCSHEIKKHLLAGRKVMTNLDSILKSTQPWAQDHSPAARTCAGLEGGEEFPGKWEDPGVWNVVGAE